MQNRMSRTDVSAVALPRTTMRLPIKLGHSLKMGRFMPLDFIPVFREDSVSGGFDFSLSLSETYEMLINPPRVRISAWFVSKLAEPRFSKSAAVLLRSFMGEPETDSEDAIVQPYFEVLEDAPAVSTIALARALGLHWNTGDDINTTPFEVYNLIWNHCARNRSADIEARELDDYSLAPAFWWADSPFGSVVPQVDTGSIAGEVPLTVVESKMPVTGLGKFTGGFAGNTHALRESGGATRTYAKGSTIGGTTSTQDTSFVIEEDPDNPGYPGVFAELQEHGITISMANIQQAGAIARFARERMKREGHEAEWMIDAMLQGLSIPDAEQIYPIMLNQTVVQFEQVLETANDGPSLGEKFALGAARGRLQFRLPVQAHGGTIMFIAEVLPEQLFEDQADPLLYALSADDVPNRMRDELKTAPFEAIENGQVSVYHSAPKAQFGYQPNNGSWLRHPPRFGGELHRTAGGSNSTVARRMLYPTEYIDPKLTEDFYLSEQIGLSPFMNQAVDPIKFGARGEVIVNGLTLVGYAVESEENYDAVAEHAVPLGAGEGE